MPYEIDMSIPLECINKGELLERIEQNAHVVIVDTIGTYGGNSVKIKGAITIPYPDVIDRRKELAGYDEVIIYCKHKTCKASKKVAAGLTVLNMRNIKVYEGGIDEWTAAGLPVQEVQ